jgi:ABC-type transport system involved in cytochrome c biogenesis permease subunit
MKRFLPWLIALFFIGWTVSQMVPRRQPPGFDIAGFGRLPVLVGGRVMPMDSLARVSLTLMNHYGAYQGLDHKPIKKQSQWLLDVMMIPEHADDDKVFEVSNPDVLALFQWQEGNGEPQYHSFHELRPFFAEINKQAGLASQIEAELRNPFQRAILKLHDALRTYIQLKNTIQVEDSPDFGKELMAFERGIAPGMQAIRDRDADKPFNQFDFEQILLFTQRYQNLSQIKYAYVIPNPTAKVENERWQPISEALLGALSTGKVPDAAQAYGRLISAYRANDLNRFNQAITDYDQYLARTIPQQIQRPHLEFLFNGAQPFYQAIFLYAIVFLFSLFSWLIWPKVFGKSALLILAFTFLIHTAGLVTRMYLQGRPPVTNLYSSAIFVGWGSVLLCLLLERFYKNGIAGLCGATIGFVTLLIAQNLQLDGDTLEMLRAVLDTNIWLATHVVCEVFGYSAAFLAGFLGIVYIVRGLFMKSFDQVTARSLGRMIYGVVCFAMLFSLVGTILGGIWGDQSWGRFWGWDPKENGALLVVIWNAIILHARWGGYARDRGIAMMAVFGNVITSLSWFGVNMLGIGLHSYGFMEQAFGPLLSFIMGQLAIIGLALIPQKYWCGLKANEKAPVGEEKKFAAESAV